MGSQRQGSVIRDVCGDAGLEFGECVGCDRQRCRWPESKLCRVCTDFLNIGYGDRIAAP